MDFDVTVTRIVIGGVGLLVGGVVGWIIGNRDYQGDRKRRWFGWTSHHGLMATPGWDADDVASAASRILRDREKDKEVERALSNSEAGRVYEPRDRRPGASTENGKPTLVS